MPLREPLYKSDIAILKKLGDNYKLTLCHTLRTAGLEYDIKHSHTQKGSVNSSKLSNNISRARSIVFELASCNKWEYFVTLTIDKAKYDRYQLKEFYKAFGIFIQNLNRDNNCKVQYLLIPEQHVDGAWHLHGLFNDIPKSLLKQFTADMHVPYYILDKVNANHELYYLESYQKRFGFCHFEPIKDINRISSYITKYITKDLEKSVNELGGHLYYRSRKLKRAELVQKGRLIAPIIEPDFENDYVKIKWFNSVESALTLFEERGAVSV